MMAGSNGNIEHVSCQLWYPYGRVLLRPSIYMVIETMMAVFSLSMPVALSVGPDAFQTSTQTLREPRYGPSIEQSRLDPFSMAGTLFLCSTMSARTLIKDYQQAESRSCTADVVKQKNIDDISSCCCGVPAIMGTAVVYAQSSANRTIS